MCSVRDTLSPWSHRITTGVSGPLTLPKEARARADPSKRMSSVPLSKSASNVTTEPAPRPITGAKAESSHEPAGGGHGS